jgi:hypothetical protein
MDDFEGAGLLALLLRTSSRGSTFMKRFGALLASCYVAAAIAGCGGGLEEGLPTKVETAAGGVPPGFKEMMEQQSKKMKMKRPPRTATTKPAAP